MSREHSTVELRSAVIKGVKVGEYEIKVTSNPSGNGWTATGLMPDGKKVISGPASSQEDAEHDIFMQAQSRLYPNMKVEFTKKFESMDKETAITNRRADGLLEAVIGREWVPPHQNLGDDAELEMAARTPFTAWEYALRTNKHHPKLLKAVFGSPYEKLYKRHFKLPQFDPFYENKWLKGAVNPEHKGYCTPMTKKTCTPRRKALARRFKSGDLSQESIKVEADKLLEAPGYYEISDDGEPTDNPECPQCGGPGVPMGSLGSLIHFRCRNCGWEFSESKEPMSPPPKAMGLIKMGEANFHTSAEKRALRRRSKVPIPKKAAFYPSDGGGGGGGGGITSAV